MSLLRRRGMMAKKAEHTQINVNLMQHCEDGIGINGWLGYINDSTGKTAGYGNSYPTDFILYVQSHRYEIYVPDTGFYAGKLYCYGLQKEFITFVKFNVGNPEIVKNIPENAKYIRFVTSIDDWDLSYFKRIL